jgi:hypothetical protein
MHYFILMKDSKIFEKSQRVPFRVTSQRVAFFQNKLDRITVEYHIESRNHGHSRTDLQTGRDFADAVLFYCLGKNPLPFIQIHLNV